jgi:broad specificity phosphatase PhoE
LNSSDSWDSLEWLSDARGLLEWIPQLGTKPAVLLLRHSERRVGLSVIDALEVELTPVGHEIAQEFGRRLPKGKKITLLHSPHIRTTQTAERIAEGVSDNGGTISHLASMDILW